MDSIGFKAGISWPPISFGNGDIRAPTAQISANLGRSNNINNPTTSSSSVSSRFSFAHPLKSFWRKAGDGDGISVEDTAVVVERENIGGEIRENNGSWVLKILHVRSLWKEQENDGILVEKEAVGEQRIEEGNVDEPVKDQGIGCFNCDGGEGIEGCLVEEDEEEKIEFDKDSFSKLLKRVSLVDAKLYARLSYLGNLAYSIPKIKPASLLKHHGFRFITSSIKKKALEGNVEEGQNHDRENKPEETKLEVEEQRVNSSRISAYAAFHIAASAASYLQSHTKNILSFKTSKGAAGGDSVDGGSEINENAEVKSSELASFVATTDSVTAVVAAKEETKQAVAKELNSGSPSPCEWFICDDDESLTRFFVIQGSESFASWQANLLFEPIQFEGLDVLVHRGIYEAAKGIYEQMLPEVRAHLKAHGDSATFRFTGHSLGGSLSLLVHLMLLIRGEVPLSSLLPVIMFGAPSVMCGGDQLLRRLGLPRSHVKAITMHRDIVPRAFSCNYPDHVVELLKAVNGNFRSHPCLKSQKVLYAPMGDILILQPEEKFSPHHHLLPSGSGLYLLTRPISNSVDPEKHLRAAKAVFFNSPHPLEILSDRSAYGSDGTIYRDHDMHSYFKCVLGVIRLELNQIRKTKREHRRKVWWPRVAPQDIHGEAVVGRRVDSTTVSWAQVQPSFSGIFHNGRESLKRFSRIVASQHMHLLVVMLFPARLLVLGAFAVTRFG
ncbi:hypothetical protein ACHQM5_026326 [Ranunculus cassubicifolius]